jgi:ribosome recycling factor
MADPDLGPLKKRMDGALEVLRKEFAGLRTGRASTALLEPVVVEAYGNKMPINQVGSISVPDARTITVQVWDKGLVNSVEKAIRTAPLGLNPQAEGQVIRVPIPQLSQDRRQEIAKIAAKYAEQARVAVRNVRRDGMDMLKKMEKDHEISQDQHKTWSQKLQAMTDEHVKLIDTSIAQKDKEIMQV